jgi:hypothetical protein
LDFRAFVLVTIGQPPTPNSQVPNPQERGKGGSSWKLGVGGWELIWLEEFFITLLG